MSRQLRSLLILSLAATACGEQPEQLATTEPLLLRAIQPLPHENEPNLPPYDFKAKSGVMSWDEYKKNISPAFSPSTERPTLIHVDFQRGEERAIELDPEELAILGEELRAAGYAEASSEVNSLQGSPIILPAPSRWFGWSGAVDNRVRKSVDNGYPVNENSLRRMGQVNRGCTGTLVGKRLVLTAAHCVLNDTLTWPQQAYRARNDGNNAPYGTERTSSIYYDNQFVANNCHVTYNGDTFDRCVRWDWAVMVLREEAWEGVASPGWMGFRFDSENSLRTYAVQNDGYPGCNLAESPANCRANTVYGQVAACSIDYFAQPNTFQGATPIGYNLTFRHGCDMGRGHSGSAVYTYDGGENGPYVLGVNVWQRCGTCAGTAGNTRSHPNVAVRIKPWLGNFLLDLRRRHP